MLNDVDKLVIYWINLESSIDRRKHMKKILQDPVFDGIPKKRFVAFDGSIKNAEKRLVIPKKSPHITPNVYALLVSNLDVIRTFAKSSYNYALIFEDDLSLEYKRYWKKSLNEVIKNAPSDWEILQLGYGINHNNDIPEREYTPMSVGHYFQTISYLINKPAAIRFINEYYANGKYILYKNICQESDNFIFNVLNTYTYKYPFFTNDLSFHSNVGTSTIYSRLSKQAITTKLFQNKNKNKKHKHNKTVKWRATRCIKGVRKIGFVQ